MIKYVCTVCGYVYDPEIGDPDNGIEPGTPFEELPEDWVCPLCSLGKDVFQEAEESEGQGAEGFEDFEDVETYGNLEDE